MCLAVTIEALVLSLDQWRRTSGMIAAQVYPRRKYGWATYLAWLIFGEHLFAALCFAIGSRKRKGSRAATVEFEREDRAVQIGR